ncbi:MAG: GTP-binding protein, partial [Betaproteobacteria bacterium]|nr:GTP-binding protein [Betaproteobacteria bacterium]
MTPTLIVGGYLGAGKTTLVNHLLRHADGRRIAVMVNDFGELTIDADLIEGAEGSVLALA